MLRQPIRVILACSVLFVLLNNSLSFSQSNWPRFRGPNGSGLVEETKLPEDISEAEYHWKVKLAGIGSSSPVIWGKHLFVTSCDPSSGNLTLECLDAFSGKVRWSKVFQQGVYRVHGRNNFASSTPAVDENHIYLTYADPDHTMLVALDHDGNQKWQRDFGTWTSQHGFAASPMVYGDKVIVFNSQQSQRLKPDQSPGGSHMIAVKGETGENAWSSSLTSTRACYAIPSIYRDENGVEQLVSCNTGDGFFSLDPETGEQNWATLPFRMRTVASTLTAGGLIIGSNGSGGGGNYLVAIRPGKDLKTVPEKVYEISKANYVPTPIAVGGKLYLFSDKGIGQCVELQTGKPIWEKRMAKGFSGSPIATSSNIYIMDESGNLLVIGLGSQYEEICKHSLGESTRATPAVAGDRLYLRTDSHLICVGNK